MVNAANGAGKRTKPNAPRKVAAHPRFKSVLRSEAFPKGPVGDITADPPAVKFHVKAIYDHLVHLYLRWRSCGREDELTHGAEDETQSGPRSTLGLGLAFPGVLGRTEGSDESGPRRFLEREAGAVKAASTYWKNACTNVCLCVHSSTQVDGD